MFEPASLSITSALNPAAVPANAVMLENAGTPGDPAEAPQTGGFEALLAQQSAQSQHLAPGTSAALNILAKAAGLAAEQPATGKTLPDAAMPVAAFAAESEETPGEPVAESAVATPEGLADPALLASIFASPDRLAPKGTDGGNPRKAAGTVQVDVPNPAKNAQDLAASLKPGRIADTGRNQPAVAAAVAIAQAAVIDMEPGAKPLLPQAPVDKITPALNVAADLQTRPGTTAPAAMQAQNTTHDVAQGLTQGPAQGPAQNLAQNLAQPRDTATEAATAPTPPALVAALAKDTGEQAALPDLAGDMAADLAAPLIARASDAVTMQEAAPAAKAEPRAERVDFATLVETLNRAREDASPNTLRVSLAHADFGRVSMRFDQNDKGMQVSMSSADPGFARAVAASNEAASTATSSDSQRGQSSQANTSGNAQRDGSRQHQGQNPDPQTRPAMQLRDTLRRKEESGSSSGVFA